MWSSFWRWLRDLLEYLRKLLIREKRIARIRFTFDPPTYKM